MAFWKWSGGLRGISIRHNGVSLIERGVRWGEGEGLDGDGEKGVG